MGTMTSPRALIIRDGDAERHVTTNADGAVSVDGGAAMVVRRAGRGLVRIDGARVGDAPTRTAWIAAVKDKRWVFLEGEVYELEVQPEGRRRRSAGQASSLAAPMPATVLRVKVCAGDVVRRGDTLVILEAMKMELPVRAPADATVTAVRCKQGDLVQPGVPLIEIA